MNNNPEEVRNENLEKAIGFLKGQAGLSEEAISEVRAELLTYRPEELHSYSEVLRLTSLALGNVRNSYDHQIGRRKPPRSSRPSLTFTCETQFNLPVSIR